MYYSAIGMLAIIVLLIVNHDILLNRDRAFESPSWGVYRRFLFTVLVYYVADVLWGLLESRKLATLLFVDTTVYVHPEDQATLINAMNRQFLTEALDRSRVFEMTYRRIKNSASFYVQMKVSRMEDDNRYIVIGVTNIDEQMRQRREEERMKEERTTYERIHALTGNFIAIYVVDPVTDRYREFGSVDGYDERFGQSKEGERFFDTARQAGDQYLCDACKTICDTFKRSPVFRVGGDEFAVICQGSDYECVDELLAKMRDDNGTASHTGGTTIVCGMARFEDDECVASVFERADSSMYENKKALKAARHDTDA